jgi:arsenite-transporting ATPase
LSSPRTILYTGKGGVGKTSVAAATALRCAAAGRRTLILSTDPAHSLSESLEAELSGAPTEVADGLWAQEVQAQAEMERHWSAVQGWLGELLMERGVDRVSAEELTVPPGMDELFSLLQLKEAHESGKWDLVVVDCAPTGETLRLLSFPDVARWWLEKVFPWEKQLLAAARPLARTLLDIPLPTEAAFADVQRLSRNLIAMNEILRDRSSCTVRLVMNPDRMVIHEAMRTFTYLNLYGYLTDAVVVNRVFPADVGEYFAGWRELQQEHLALVESAFAPVPVLRAPYFEQEVTGAAMLARLADAVFASRDAADVLHHRLAQELEIVEGGAVVSIDLPLARKADISLKKIGPELVVRVDGQKRTIILPPALASYRPREAAFADGTLRVTLDGQPRPEEPRPARPEPA